MKDVDLGTLVVSAHPVVPAVVLRSEYDREERETGEGRKEHEVIDEIPRERGEPNRDAPPDKVL